MRYRLAQTIPSGEFSMDVEGLRANAPGDRFVDADVDELFEPAIGADDAERPVPRVEEFHRDLNEPAQQDRELQSPGQVIADVQQHAQATLRLGTFAHVASSHPPVPLAHVQGRSVDGLWGALGG